MGIEIIGSKRSDRSVIDTTPEAPGRVGPAESASQPLAKPGSATIGGDSTSAARTLAHDSDIRLPHFAPGDASVSLADLAQSKEKAAVVVEYLLSLLRFYGTEEAPPGNRMDPAAALSSYLQRISAAEQVADVVSLLVNLTGIEVSPSATGAAHKILTDGSQN